MTDRKHKMAQAIALAVAGTTFMFGEVSPVSAHTMYNTFTASDSSTDGWNYGSLNGSYPTVTPGWLGTATPGTLPFGYSGGAWLNWAAEIHTPGETEVISRSAAAEDYNGAVVDIDTNKGSWRDFGNTFGTDQGWAHNTDIGLIQSEENAYITLNVVNAEGTEPNFTNFGISVFQGMDQSTGDVNHHSEWNCPTCDPSTPYTSDNPFGLSGLTYLTHSANVDGSTSLTFLAQAGQVYSIFLGGANAGSVFFPTQDYQLTIASAPVPVPAAVWLFGSTLVGWVAIGRRKAVA